MTCKLRVIILTILLTYTINKINADKHGADVDDNEFAEFEDEFESDGSDIVDNDDSSDIENTNAIGNIEQDTNEFGDEEDAVVEVEGEEFAALDPDEFEGLDDSDDTIWDNDDDNTVLKKPNKNAKKPELKIANVPLNARTWDKYFSEILALTGILVYLLNFIHGKFKNSYLATSWLSSHLEYLKSQFELVGDDGIEKDVQSSFQLNKETEHLYNLWCSGRASVNGLLVELKLMKRQDLISIISNYIVPTRDQVILSIELDTLDSFVFACGNKKTVAKIQKNLEDMTLYCNDKMKSGEKFGLPETMGLVSEHGEVINSVLDAKVKQVINQYSDLFDYVHISDQYSGPKPYSQDEAPVSAPETTKKLTFSFNYPTTASHNVCDIDKMLPLTKMALYMADKLNK